MNNELKPYREYKKVDLLWIDKIPKHWKMVGNRTLWAERKTQNCIDEELLSVTIKKGIIKQADLLKNTSKKDSSNLDKSKYKLVLPRDIAYNKMRMWQGAVGSSKYKGIVSPAYIVLKPISELNPNYYHYLMRIPDYIEESHRHSYGMCDDQLNLRYEDFKQMRIIKPPLDEQDQIVKYLDFKLAKINKFIKSKKKLIEVLKEQKQAVINEAVTKGINPNVKKKPSGIEWLGDIPEHWECKRLKTVVQNITLNTNKKLPQEIYIGLENVEGWTGKIINASTNTVFDSQVKKFTINNILFGKLRPYLAKVVTTTQNGVCSGEFLVLKLLDRNHTIKYLEILLRSNIIIDIITSSTYGAKMPRAEWGFIGRLKVAMPDTIKEQEEIVDYIAKKIEGIDKSIEKIEKEIELITEYRTRLISDVVTGKVDVRHIKIDDIIEEGTEIDETEDEEIDKDEILDNED